ncbi:DNA alkylation repair protein [Natronosporangium hydrolyticum]|uniref:DNA alkylation repair protein n=1 Tax=Natronosporangium hydrolyticum TaxID=2811111 RepID=A0A895Y9Y2_9ACTN|nr:DNA alkylation repair protein [Natronosporangium hydrolyticum]QSB13115.1 DNA alkylation repair protein [Natronosporangium hydrolyticum]
MSSLTAEQFIATMKSLQSDQERQKIRRYFKAAGADNEVIGVRMKHIFDTAKRSKDMPLDQVEQLLDSPYYEGRVGAVSILDFKARGRKLTDADRRALYEIYLGKHDRINNWDLVDRSAPRVVGCYLVDKPRNVLYELARSTDIWRRRTAIVATWYFVFYDDDFTDALEIAEILLKDQEELINKAVGTTLRYVGDHDRQALLSFLDQHAHDLPRVALRYAIEKLEPEQRNHYLTLGK